MRLILETWRYLMSVITWLFNVWFEDLSARSRYQRAETSNYMPQNLWDVITCPCPIYLLLATQACIWLTHWGRVMHLCIGKLTIIGSDNGLSPGRRQAIIWTNAGIFLIGPLGTNFREILIEILTFSFKTMHLKMLSGKWRPFCLGLNVLILRGLFSGCLWS